MDSDKLIHTPFLYLMTLRIRWSGMVQGWIRQWVGGGGGGGGASSPSYPQESHGASLSPSYKFEEEEGWKGRREEEEELKSPLSSILHPPLAWWVRVSL
jgi:hypothetical protein